MNNLMGQTIFGLIIILKALQANAAAPDVDNYRNVIQGVMGKFDRDYRDLNPAGQAAPGALGTVEIFLTKFNENGINGPGEYHIFLPDGTDEATCSVVSPTCQEIKVVVQTSFHTDATLMGIPNRFKWDVIVWSSHGSDFIRFLEGHYTPVANTGGQGNITVISCGGCSTVGHSQIEWDASGTQYELRSLMFDSKVQEGPEVYAGVIIDAKYTPSTGDMKLAIAANNACDSSGTGDSICVPANTAQDHGAGYSAILHANTKTGNVFVSGMQGANDSAVSVSGADAMCIKADHTADLTNAACIADGIDNFTGITGYSPSQAPQSFISSGSPWPLAEVLDTPTF